MKVRSSIVQKGVLSVLSIAVIASLSGCTQRTTTTSCGTELTKQSSKDIEVAKLKSNINKTVVIKQKSEMLPPNAKPGECYARVMVPAKYITKKVKVLVKEPSTKIVTVPAKFREVTKKVLVKEASTKVVTTPPVYKLVKEKVLVKQPSKKLIPVPAVYKTVKEKVLVKPAHTEWKRGKGLYNNVIKTKYTPTGEIMCLVKMPPVYKIVTKRIMVKPAGTKEVVVPAVYKTITKKVLEKPAMEKVVKVPAVYKTVKTKELVTPAQTKEIPVPAVYKYVNRTVKVADSQIKWMETICKTNLTMPRVMMIQRALKRAGFFRGEIDGVWGEESQRALTAFQKAKGLATGGITIESLRALGVYR